MAADCPYRSVSYEGTQGTLKGKLLNEFLVLPQVVYLIGALIGIGACAYVWFGQGEFFHSYGVYIVASLFGKAIESTAL